MAMSASTRAKLEARAQGTGPEAEIARRKLASQPIGARTPTVTRSSGTMRGAIGGGGVRAGTPARLPIRGAIGTGSGRNLPVPYTGGGGGLATTGRKKVGSGMPGPGGGATKPPRFNPRTMMGIGLGLGVAASVAMNRRGEGASSGRQSIYKY